MPKAMLINNFCITDPFEDLVKATDPLAKESIDTHTLFCILFFNRF